MPVSPATAEHLAAGVVAHYQDAEAALTARIAKNLSRGIDAPFWAQQKLAQMQEYERQARRLLADLEKKAASGVATAITEAYDRGGLSAVADIAKLQMSDAMKYSAIEWQPTPLRPWVIREPDGRALHKFDTAEKAQAFVDKHPAYMGTAPVVENLAGLRAVEALTQETLGNVLATHPGILRSVMDTYRSVIAESSPGVLLGDQTRRQAAQAALNRFAAAGIKGFTDKAGRAWSMESYTEMAMRTGCGRAAVQGHVDRLTANGLNLVIVSDAPKECPLCRPWEGKVLSIGGVPVEMPEGTDPAFQVDSEAAVEVPTATVPDEWVPLKSTAECEDYVGEWADADFSKLSIKDANAFAWAMRDERLAGGKMNIRTITSKMERRNAAAEWEPVNHKLHYSQTNVKRIGEPVLETAAERVTRLETLAAQWDAWMQADKAAGQYIVRNARNARAVNRELAEAKLAFAEGRAALPFNAFNYAHDRSEAVRILWTHELGHMRSTQRGDLQPMVEGWFDHVASSPEAPRFASDYSRKNAEEWWAESFSLWRYGRGDLIDHRLRDLFERELKGTVTP